MNVADPIGSLRPLIRVFHSYRFPPERNPSESERFGYCHAFHTVEAGKGSIVLEGKSYPVKKGDFVYFPPRARHSFFTDAEQPLTTHNLYCELWELSTTPSAPHIVWNEDDYADALETRMLPCPELDRLPAVVPLQHEPELHALFNHAFRVHEQKDRFSATIAENLLRAFLLELLQKSGSGLYVDFRIKPILERIGKEASGDYRYGDWLADCGLRKSHFHDLFKQATGMSPKAYWTRSVMRRAAAALTESARSVTAIADELGYSSIHHFTKQFTVYFGVSPSGYRNRRLSIGSGLIRSVERRPSSAPEEEL